MTTLNQFAQAYPDQSTRFPFDVASPLLGRDQLVELIGTLDPHLVEYNRGDLPLSVDPDDIPAAGIPPEEVIRTIGSNNSWMTIRNIENNAKFAALADELLGRVKPVVIPKTGPMLRREAFIFVSSQGAVTPFHFDEEHNILLQVEGYKTVTVFSQYDRDLASQQDLEQFHSGGHRNLTLDPAHIERGTPIKMGPGDALYIPPLAPHFVEVTDGPAVSLSITWRSRMTMRALYLHQINHERRLQGQNPRFPGQAPLIDQLKIWKASAARRLDSLKRQSIGR